MSEQQPKILIADSDDASSQLTAFYLTQALYDNRVVSDADRILPECLTNTPDLVLLDPVFPGKEHFQILQDLRLASEIPVILLSSSGDVEERIHGLDLGADDYMAKPYDARELLARIRAVLRRYHPPEKKRPADIESGEFVKYPDLIISLTNYSVTYQGKNIDLPPKELELLYFLASSPNQVFSREQLLDRLWGFDYMGDTRTVDVHIKRLREKFRANKYWAIKTVWGIGYKFEVKVKESA